jgi:PAS domain S-box-containing protein
VDTLQNENEVLSAALAAFTQYEGEELHALLDRLQAPVYVTDAQGVVTYFNPSCTGFAGRTPAVGKDRWCVTWKLYTDEGEFLPHDQCPMAAAIKERRPIRGMTAVAERPDGTRVNFMPYPTPLFGPDGSLQGAVNILIDITEKRQLAELRRQAERCRRLADCTNDAGIRKTLLAMADEYEQSAARLAEAHGLAMRAS